MIKRITSTAVLALAMTGAFVTLPAYAADGETKCHMTFDTKGWAAIVKVINGTGNVTCDNGQKAKVAIKVRGAGFTAGKYSIDNGKGEFTKLKDISEIYGAYATAGANAGVVKSAEGLVMTKGEVSLAVSGTGRGFNLGVDVSAFEIEHPKSRSR